MTEVKKTVFTEQRRPFVFEVYPGDWIGRIIEEWEDGYVTLDSGLFSRERHILENPTRVMTISPETTGEEISRWLDGVA